MRQYLLLKHAIIQCLVLLSLSSIAESASHSVDNTIAMDQTRQSVESAENMFYFEDATHQQNLENILQLGQKQWAHLPNNIANFGFSESIYWFSFNIDNKGQENLSLFVHLDYALLDRIDFYSIEDGQVGQHIQAGDKLAFKQRAVDYPTFLFPVDLKQNQSKRIIIRVETTGTLQVPLSVWQREAFLLNAQDSLFLYGCFLSALLIMSAYNLCLFLMIRESTYLLYSVFIIMIVGVHSSLDGFAYQWFWPDFSEWHQVSAITFIALGCIFTVLFTKAILPIPERSHIAKGIKILIALAVISAIISFFIPYRQAAMLNGMTTIIVMSSVVAICIAMLKYSPRTAKLYATAWSAYFTGLILKSSSKMGFLPYSMFTEYAGNIGAVVGIIIISLALADRINSERRAKVDAQNQAIGNLKRFQMLYENALEGIFNFDLKGKLLSANPAFLKLIGVKNLASFTGNYQQLEGYVLPPAAFSQLANRVKKEGEVVDYETQLRNKDNMTLWVNISARLSEDIDTGAEQMEGTLININDRKVFEQQLQHLASHDSLTGFYNRRAFESSAKDKLEAVKCYQEECCMLYMDLDQFKIVNDLCGHTAGDLLLKNLSQRLLKKVDELGEGQILARLGGDEFGVLLSRTNLEKAQIIAEKFRKSIENFLFVWEGNRYTLGVSIGLVELRPYHHSVEQILVMADTACYMAKDQGRNRVHSFIETDKDLQFRQLEMQWVSTIKEALLNDQFFLVFQHISSNKQEDEKLHYEILLRLMNENGNLCAPNQFLPAAERYNLMPNIDRWVIRHYFTWLQRNPLHLDELDSASINLSTQSIGDETFAHFLVTVFDEFNIPPSKICFEITESMAITHLDNTHAFIEKFHNLGCRFALDDFGTGFSSYAYLKELQVDYLKIDGVFIKNLTHDPVDLAMVKSISDVAKAIGIETIAEFVETQEIREKLIDIGITYSQGYHIHKPVRLEADAFSFEGRHTSQPLQS